MPRRTPVLPSEVALAASGPGAVEWAASCGASTCDNVYQAPVNRAGKTSLHSGNSVTNSFFKSTSTVELIAASVCETTTPSKLKQVSADRSVTQHALTSNPRTDQASNTTYQLIPQTSPQTSPQVGNQCSEGQTSSQPGDRLNSQTSSGFGNPSKPQTSLHMLNQFNTHTQSQLLLQSGLPRQLPSMEHDQLMTLSQFTQQSGLPRQLPSMEHDQLMTLSQFTQQSGLPRQPPSMEHDQLMTLSQFTQQSGLPRQPPSMERDQLMTLSQLQAQTQYKTPPFDQTHMQPFHMNDFNEFAEFISKLPTDEMTFSESEGQGQRKHDQQIHAEREVLGPNNTVVYQRLESPIYNPVISPVRRQENQEPQTNPQLTPQPDANIPNLDQFVDLDPIINRINSTPPTPNDRGLFKAIAQGDDSHLDSVQGVKGSTNSVDFIKKMAKPRRKGTRDRASRSKSSIDQNSDAYKQKLATLSPKDRAREQNRHAAKRFRDKLLKRQESQEVRAETLCEENRRLMAVKTQEEEKHKKLLNSVCVYHWTRQSLRGGQ